MFKNNDIYLILIYLINYQLDKCINFQINLNYNLILNDSKNYCCHSIDLDIQMLKLFMLRLKGENGRREITPRLQY